MNTDNSSASGITVRRCFAGLLKLLRVLALITLSLFLILLLLPLLQVPLKQIPQIPQIQQIASDRIDASAKRAVAATATILLLDALVSAIQSAEFGASFGVSGSVQPGELLDPINDMLEFITKIMFFALLSLLIQKALLLAGIKMSLSWSIGILVSLWLLLACIHKWGCHRYNFIATYLYPLLVRISKIALMIVLLPTIIMPGAVLISTNASQYIAGDIYDASEKSLQSYDLESFTSVVEEEPVAEIEKETTGVVAEELESGVLEEDGDTGASWWNKSWRKSRDIVTNVWRKSHDVVTNVRDTIKNPIPNVVAKLKSTISANVDKVKNFSRAIFELLIDFLIIFLFESFIFPLLFLVLTYICWKPLVRWMLK